MTIRELLKKPFWSPHDLSLVTGISLTTARKRLVQIREELEKQGYLNLDKSKAPTSIVIARLNIDIEFLDQTGGLDIDIDLSE